jgi:hypothetical protein
VRVILGGRKGLHAPTPYQTLSIVETK